MSSEFESLSDIVLARGVKHSEIISLIHEKVLLEFSVRYQKELKDTAVVVDEKSGSVRVYLNKIDITPSDFIPVAEKIALQVLIQKLGETENRSYRSSQSSYPSSPQGGFSKWLAGFLFWIYNGWYVLFILLSLLNLTFNGEYRSDIFEMMDESGILRVIVFGMLLLAPFISIAIAYKDKRDGRNSRLGRIMLIFEVPFIIVLLIALSMFENATLAMWFFFLMFIFMVLVIFLDSIKIKIDSLKKKWLMLCLKQIALMTVGYFVLLYSFFVPVIIAGYLTILISSLDHISLFEIIALGFGVIIYSIIALFYVSPYIFLFHLYKKFIKARNEFANEVGIKSLNKVHIILAFGWAFSLFLVSYQPGADLTIKLEKLKTIQSFKEREKLAQELIPNEAKIDQELKNISNARKQYFISKSDESLKRSYQNNLRFGDTMGDFVQNMFLSIAYPFVYQGSFNSSGVAFDNYVYLFGHQYGANPSEPTASGNVMLVSRTTRAETDYLGILATISIEEEFQNTTWNNQEVVYEFSLPSNSAIMDLKLGPNLEFNGLIAPRGAAGKVYQEQKAVRKDPALLEQTGPRQYRLRVFPIPGKNDMTLGGKNQKVKFSYVAELTSEGYPLPVYSKENNITINESTKKTYYVDGETASHYVDSSFISSAYGSRISNQCNLSSPVAAKGYQNGDMSMKLVPYRGINEISNILQCEGDKGINLAGALKGAKFAVLYDVSFGNKNSTFLDEMNNILISEKTVLQNNEMDLYLFNDLLSQKEKITFDLLKNTKDVVYFGNSDWIDLIDKIETRYDFIIVATNDADISRQGKDFDIGYKAPLYIIHKDDKVPAYSVEVSNYILQSEGKVAESFEDALTHYVLSNRLSFNGSSGYVAFSPYWGIEAPFYHNEYINSQEDLNNDNSRIGASDPLLYLINRAYIMNRMNSYKGNLEDNSALLDSYHSYAKSAHVITPYSSLIALVNDQQIANLENASESKDRFTYEMPDTASNASQDCSPGSGMFCNPITANSGWRSSEAPMGASNIPQWGTKKAPRNVQTDIAGSVFNIVWMFILFNIVIVLVGGFAYPIVKFIKRNKNGGKF